MMPCSFGGCAQPGESPVEHVVEIRMRRNSRRPSRPTGGIGQERVNFVNEFFGSDAALGRRLSGRARRKNPVRL
jgi:hypothetical protein